MDVTGSAETLTVRPGWFDTTLFPFESRWLDVGGARVHYVDEGTGPTLLMLHGNPTWSFLYRHLVMWLRDRFRCIALDYPGFGLSTAPPGYGYTIAEHRDVVEGFVNALDLRDYTPVMHDWGGPIGLSVAVRDPDRVRSLIIGNTWAWPMRDKASARWFSRVLGSELLGGVLVRRLDLFARTFVPRGHLRRELSDEEFAMYRAPHPTPESRVPVHVMPEQILGAEPLLEELEASLHVVARKPALLLWATGDPAFREPERQRWESILPDHTTVLLQGAGHYWQDDAQDLVVPAIRAWFVGRGALA